MTFWATLWYAGSVVLTMGYEGMTLEECQSLTGTMLDDIAGSYERGEMADDELFPTDQFTVTCETTQLPLDEKYKK